MFKKFFKTELGRGSFILFMTMNLFWFLNFVFHILMARQLGPADYGVLAVLMSIVYIYGVPTEAIQNIVTRYTAKFNLKKTDGKIKFFMLKALRKGFMIALILFIIFIPLAFLVAKFLKINFWLIVLTNLFLFSSFSIPIVRGVLQGRKKFGLLGLGMILESVFKLILAILLVGLGFKVFGALYGVIFGVLISFIFSLEFNKRILKAKEVEEKFPDIKLESVPYFNVMLVVLLVFSIDIILAKRFFPSELAGQYAVLSMLGKMIYFGTMAIGKVMFPLTSEKCDLKEDSFAVFRKAFLIVVGLCGAAILVYGLLPNLVIGILYGAQYLEMSPYLIYSALAFSFLALSNLILLYKLCLNNVKNSWILFVFLFIEIILLSVFHGSILEYILAFMVSNIIMFIGSFFFLKQWSTRKSA